MTRLNVILLAIIATFLCFACSNPEVENEIRLLESKKVELEGQIQALQVQVDSLQKENKKMQDKLSALDMNLARIAGKPSQSCSCSR